jgi:phage terminase large subunit-like protein
MSRGLGWVQQACLLVIREYEDDGELPTTYNIAATVYLKPLKDGWRLVTEAQHVAVKRALEGLQRKGHIIGFRDTGRARIPGVDYRAELAHFWATENGAQRFVADTLKRARDVMRMGLSGESSAALAERVMKKMRAAGMKP